jgi:hypothetical protein
MQRRAAKPTVVDWDVVTVTNSARRDIDVELMPQSVVLEAQCVRNVCVCFLDALVESCQLHKHALTRIGAPAVVI